LICLAKGFVLLTGSEGDAWCKGACSVAVRLGIDLAVYRIGPAGDLLARQKHWLASAGITAKGVLLVRPDGFVAGVPANSPSISNTSWSRC
jgi:putative polyketide hydroxylase